MALSFSGHFLTPGLPDRENWLKEGLLLQAGGDLLLGEGPMTAGRRAETCGFFRPDFFLETKKPWLFPKKTFLASRRLLEDWLKEPGKGEKAMVRRERRGAFSAPVRTRAPTLTEFQTVFARLQQNIQRGVLKKAVPVFFEEIIGDFCVAELLRSLLKNTAQVRREGSLYGAWNGRGGLLGFTPETLFSFSERNLSLFALAGTGSARAGACLLKDPKETREQALVVQGIKESLEQEMIFSGQSRTEEKKFGSLKHLFTKIEGKLKAPPDFARLCRKLHPTPALGGFPGREALKQLRQFPGQKNRGFFGAPFGFFDGKSHGVCLIGIRCVEWRGGRLRVGAGGGLVEGGVLQREWRELYLKRSQVKEFFSLNRRR